MDGNPALGDRSYRIETQSRCRSMGDGGGRAGHRAGWILHCTGERSPVECTSCWQTLSRSLIDHPKMPQAQLVTD